MIEEYKLTGAQLCVAGQICGYSHLLLPEDPFRGWLVEEIGESLKQARHELNQAGLVRLEDNQLDDRLKSVVVSLGAPEKSLALNLAQRGTKISKLTMHRRDGHWLLLDHINTEEYNLRLFAPKDLLQIVGDFFKLEKQTAFKGGEINLGADTLQSARQAARQHGEEACREELEKSGLSKTQIDQLAPILVEPVSSGSVILISWEDKMADQEAALAFLEGNSGLLEITENGDNPGWVTLKPSSAEALLHQVDQTLSKFA